MPIAYIYYHPILVGNVAFWQPLFDAKNILYDSGISLVSKLVDMRLMLFLLWESDEKDTDVT
jgi:hypothetical protein